jgi:DNA-binding NtrC family response regulator
MMGQKTILIVDDEKDILELLKQVFLELSYNVLAFHDSREVLNTVDVTLVDCIITDIRMPQVDGVQLVNGLREKGLNAPVFFITGYSDYPREVLNNLNPKAIIFKPFDMDELAVLVKNQLNVK